MTDLEITKACAEAMGVKILAEGGFILASVNGCAVAYDPLHDDAQAMALVKKFNLRIWRTNFNGACGWDVGGTDSPDLNRAICECVAKMQKGKS